MRVASAELGYIIGQVHSLSHYIKKKLLKKLNLLVDLCFSFEDNKFTTQTKKMPPKSQKCERYTTIPVIINTCVYTPSSPSDFKKFYFPLISNWYQGQQSTGIKSTGMSLISKVTHTSKSAISPCC